MRNVTLLFMLVIAMLCPGNVSAKRQSKQDKATAQWEYEIEPAVGQAQQGSCIVKVWTYARNIDKAKQQAAKNAVHGIIFKGYAASTNGSRIPAQRPLVPDAATEAANAEYFSQFFADGGVYMRYVTLVNNGTPRAGDLIKVSKKQYKVGIVVSVQKDLLRKELESQGIIKALNSGF